MHSGGRDHMSLWEYLLEQVMNFRDIHWSTKSKTNITAYGTTMVQQAMIIESHISYEGNQ